MSDVSRLSRRRLLENAAAGVAATAAAVALHQPSDAAAAVSMAPSLQEQVTLQINARTGANQEQIESLAARFQETNPNVTFEGQYFASANQEYFQKLAVLFAGGTQGDVVFLTSIEGYYDYAARGQLLNIDELVTRDAVDLNQWFPSAIEMDQVNGVTYALPLWAHPSIVGLYYNQDLLDAAGIPAPDATWTLDTLMQNAQTVTQREGRAVSVFGLSPSSEYFNGISQIMASYGGQGLSDDGLTMTVNTPEAQAGIQWLADAFQTNAVAPLPGTQDRSQLMTSGKVAMFAGGYWERWNARTAWQFNWGVVPMPTGPAGTNGPLLQTDMFPIAANTDQPDAAWEFHKFLSSYDAGMVMYEINAIPSARPDIWADPVLTADPTHQVWVQAMTNAAPLRYPSNFRLREFEINFNQTLTNVWLGESDVATAVADVTQSGQQILDQPIV